MYMTVTVTVVPSPHPKRFCEPCLAAVFDEDAVARALLGVGGDGLGPVLVVLGRVDARLVLLRLLVRDQQLPVLPVAAGLVPGRADDGEVAPRAAHLVEDRVHLLERPVRRFGEEEVHGRHHERVDDSEDDVRLVLDVVERHGRDHHHHEVEDPVR